MQQFIMLIGIAGSGKSTIAKTYENENTKIVSSDETRKILFGNENDQKHNKQVFAYMHNEIVKLINQGFSVIYDATNLNARRRCEFLDWLSENTSKDIVYNTVAVYMKCPAPVAIERQTHRNRVMPSAVIERMARHLEAPCYEEGWGKIVIVEG